MWLCVPGASAVLLNISISIGTMVAILIVLVYHSSRNNPFLISLSRELAMPFLAKYGNLHVHRRAVRLGRRLYARDSEDGAMIC